MVALMPDASPQPLSAEERLARLRLARCENVGPVTFRQLLARYGSAAAALEALPALARRGGLARPIRLCSPQAARAEQEQLDALGADLLVFGEPAYPRALAAIDDAPPTLATRGHRHLLERPAVALVGARNASSGGRTLARRLARDLAEAGWLVVSGLARGIDAAAHEGALEGGTAAVLAGGVDVVYPAENAALQEAVASRGLLLAELPPGVEPQARHFPRRNRIISGLCLGVVVVEAAPRSGSLITARLAAEQGREVMAIPGSPLDPRARGCNDLLRQGATLVESAEDVLQALAGQRPPLREPTGAEFDGPAAVEPRAEELDSARTVLRELLSPTAVPVDELLRQCQFSAPTVSLVLLEMELAGLIERRPGNRVALAAEPD